MNIEQLPTRLCAQPVRWVSRARGRERMRVEWPIDNTYTIDNLDDLLKPECHLDVVVIAEGYVSS